jgi:hypothetical protein
MLTSDGTTTIASTLLAASGAVFLLYVLTLLVLALWPRRGR